MHWIKTGLLIAVAITSTATVAQDTRDAELASSDQQLNGTYRTLIRQLDLKHQTLLRTAQRAWIAFRDADCALAFGDRRDCLIQRTDERERQLRDSLYFDSLGKQIKLPTPRE